MVMKRERELWYSGNMIKTNSWRNKMIDAATVLFDDNNNDLRALPKTVRLQLLVVLSFVWSTVFTVYFFSIATMLWGWVGLVVGHLGIIFAMYFTFKQFHNMPHDKKPDPNNPPLYDDVWYGS
tara:strand:+ start:508 stop:876 length:369 start_codon:yes stop_codon:yes gene_type:complete